MQIMVRTNGLITKHLVNCDFDVKIGDEIVFTSDKGEAKGKVVATDFRCERFEDDMPKIAVRIATAQDYKNFEANCKRAEEISQKVQKKCDSKKLEMKIISCELSLDGSRLIVNFLAENRVDFRELVKELASELHSRIELRQIGARDETKIIGGLGPCGRPCCCKEFLDDYEHSTMKMAKVQGLSLNPTKISGLCGRLMCCIAYENKHYSETFREMPRLGSEVETPDGKGLATYCNLLNKTVSVKLKNGEDSFEIKEYKLEEIKVLKKNGGFEDVNA